MVLSFNSKYKNLIFLILFFHITVLKLNGQSLSIASKINSILSSLPSNTVSSIFIFDPNSKDTVYAKNIHRPMIPASNTKLFTTAVALDLLGGEFKISTKIFTDDIDLSDGIINGNLYIKGFGDATFSSQDLDSLVKQIDSLGIKKITGNIVGDDTYFDNIYSRDDWIIQERANVTLPPVSALVLNRNKIVLKLYANRKTRRKLGFKVFPNYSFVKVKMNARVTKFRARPRITYHLSNQRLTIKVSGGLRKRRYPKSYAIFPDNPPLFVALVLKEKLKSHNINITGKALTGSTPSTAELIGSRSIKLKKMISLINKNSDNFLAECLFKIIGANFSGSQGNSFYATQAILSYINDNGIYNEGSSIVDGSGISRYNTITTSAIVELLDEIYFKKEIFTDFYNSLSVSGVDGTLKDRLYSNVTLKNFRGKTGTLNGVSAISGYLTTQNGKDLIISIIMEFKKFGGNFYRNIQDKIIEELAKSN